jgi:hypothetical protein
MRLPSRCSGLREIVKGWCRYHPRRGEIRAHPSYGHQGSDFQQHTSTSTSRTQGKVSTVSPLQDGNHVTMSVAALLCQGSETKTTHGLLPQFEKRVPTTMWYRSAFLVRFPLWFRGGTGTPPCGFRCLHVTLCLVAGTFTASRNSNLSRMSCDQPAIVSKISNNDAGELAGVSLVAQTGLFDNSWVTSRPNLKKALVGCAWLSTCRNRGISLATEGFAKPCRHVPHKFGKFIRHTNTAKSATVGRSQSLEKTTSLKLLKGSHLPLSTALAWAAGTSRSSR